MLANDLKALDFDAVQRIIEKLTQTPYGAEAARGLVPAPSRQVALQMQAAVTAAREAVDGGELPPWGEVPQIHAALRQAGAQGAMLRPRALFHIMQVLQAGRAVQPLVERRPALYPQGPAPLTPPQALWQRLQATILPTGGLRDDATPELAELNAQYQASRAEAEGVIRERMRRPDVAEYVKEHDKVFWQGDRAVLAIARSQVDRVQGVRHGTHLGGRDELVEPLEAVAANNRTETLCGQVSAQQQVVLRELTALVREAGEALQGLVDAITWVDLAFAAGRFSGQIGAHAPALAETPGVRLHGAYHPLLLLQFSEGTLERPVSLDLELDADNAITVITGPNTGGKTVALKTLGLLTAMAQCGLHIPADGDCVFGWYARIMVDVGDRQSLYHHLSTFAGHVEVLKRILDQADGETLVLLDELGTGTDPEEGAALAMAVLDELAGRGVQGIVNTHLSPLKDYAARTPHLRNACMLFDEVSLKPTYRLRTGQAGISLGLTVAQASGLPEPLVERARRHLDDITN